MKHRVIETTEQLQGPEKAAILFLCLGEERGSKLMSQLSEKEIQTITRAVSELGMIPSPVVEEVLTEFAVDLHRGGGVRGSAVVAEKLLKTFLDDDQVAAIMNEIRGPMRETEVWEELVRFGDLNVSRYLRSEHPQTAAAILKNLEPAFAAKVLPLLGKELMIEVVERMMKIEDIPSDTLREIELELEREISGFYSAENKSDRISEMADLFGRLEGDAFDVLDEVLAEQEAETYAEIRAKMFTFEDIRKIDDKGVAAVMKNAEGSTLALALRGADQDFRDVFLNVMPARTRDMLLEEMSMMGAVRGKDVRAAQSELTQIAKELLNANEIELRPDKGDLIE